MSPNPTTQPSHNGGNSDLEKSSVPMDLDASDSTAQSESPDTQSLGQHENTLRDTDAISPVTEPKRRITGIRWLLVCVAIFSANILYGLDTTIVADTKVLCWLGIGFTLGSAVAILLLGKAYSGFDNKWIFTGCLINFAAASALCGAAPNMQAMIVGRVWAGVGGAGMYLGTLNLVTVFSTPKEQPFYIGLTGFSYGSGCILGPIVGGAFADSSATWRW